MSLLSIFTSPPDPPSRFCVTSHAMCPCTHQEVQFDAAPEQSLGFMTTLVNLDQIQDGPSSGCHNVVFVDHKAPSYSCTR